MPTCGVAGCAVHSPFIADWFDVPWYPGKHHVDIGCNRADHRGVSCRAWMQAVGRSDKPIDVSLPQPAPMAYQPVPWCGYAGCATHPERRDLRKPSDRRLARNPLVLNAKLVRELRDSIWAHRQGEMTTLAAEVQWREGQTRRQFLGGDVLQGEMTTPADKPQPWDKPIAGVGFDMASTVPDRTAIVELKPLGEGRYHLNAYFGTPAEIANMRKFDTVAIDGEMQRISGELLSGFQADGGGIRADGQPDRPEPYPAKPDDEIKGVETKVDVFPPRLVGRLLKDVEPSNTLMCVDLPDVQVGDIITTGRRRFELFKVLTVSRITGLAMLGRDFPPHWDISVERGHGGTTAYRRKAGKRVEVIGRIAHHVAVPLPHDYDDQPTTP